MLAKRIPTEQEIQTTVEQYIDAYGDSASLEANMDTCGLVNSPDVYEFDLMYEVSRLLRDLSKRS